MKIGLITYSLNIGGVSTFILSLSKFFREKGHFVEVITEEKRGPWFDDLCKEGIASDSIYCGLYAWLPFGTLIHSYRVGRFIKSKNYDVILLNYALHAQLTAQMYNSKSIVISIVHNDNKGIYQTAIRNLNNISAISCVSSATFIRIKKFTDFKNIYCIPNGIQLPDTLPRFPKKKEDLLNIIFVGHLSNEQKGIFLIPAILKKCKEKKISNIHLTIVGEGKDKQELVRLLHDHHVYEMVTFKGNISRSAVYDLYLCHQLFLMPSYYEGLPLTLIESMACGCVPIVSFLKDITDFCVEDKHEGFLCPIGDTEDFAEKIVYFGLNPLLIDEFGERCVQKAVNRFSLNRMGEDYLHLINNLKELNSNFDGFNLNIFSFKDILPRKVVLWFKKLMRKYLTYF